MVNGLSSEKRDLPQGSPLSLVLFLFFNADLVQGQINRDRESIAFVDNFSVWVTGRSAADNYEGL